MLPPHWLDQIIDDALAEQEDEQVVAQAIANSEPFLSAIRNGIANPPQKGVMGPTHAQVIREEVRKAIAKA